MALVEQICPTCGGIMQVHFGQSIGYGDELWWSEGQICTSFDHRQEADDMGFPPKAVRELIVTGHGEWEVTVDDEAARTATALVAKDVFELDGRAAVKFARSIPGPIWSGTRCEAEWLRRHLAKRDVTAVVRRKGDIVPAKPR